MVPAKTSTENLPPQERQGVEMNQESFEASTDAMLWRPELPTTRESCCMECLALALEGIDIPSCEKRRRRGLKGMISDCGAPLAKAKRKS